MAGEKQFWTYIVANGKNRKIYNGHTDNLAQRMWQHQTKAFKGFASQHGCDRLVWCEPFDTREEAFLRERRTRNGAAPERCS